ncbi:MAG: dTDP-4-dehydrorhamnose reductase [Chitinophagaceae bacterium]|nr:dTDP-4-dehydrorhamnose reductase [Chitinophagaceae bacterium]
MQKLKIIVTGADGQLGRSIQHIAPAFDGYEFIFLSRAGLQVNDEAAVNAFFEKSMPGFCINCAAYTAVDAAETHVEEAFSVNAGGAGILAAACARYHVKLIHISTDYVFNGRSSIPYLPGSNTDPVSIYGLSKAKGEELVMAAGPATVIIRTSWVYSEYGKNFVKTMLRLMTEREQVNVVNDQTGAPTYAADLAGAIMRIVEAGAQHAGIYHYSNEGCITWYQLALAIKELTGSGCQINPIPSSEYPTPAKRPSFSLLDTAAITGSYGIQMLPWKQSLETCIRNILAWRI